MLRRSLLLFVLVLVCVFSGLAQTVDEARISAIIRGGDTFVTLNVAATASAKSVPVVVEVLSEGEDIVIAQVTTKVDLKAGQQTVEVTLPTKKIVDNANIDLSWLRLRYRVGDPNGIVSMSQIVNGLFELSVVSGKYVFTGSTHRVRVRAADPIYDKPVAGVEVEAVAEIELQGDGDQKYTVKGTATSDADGIAEIDLSIPAEINADDDGELTVIGIRDGIRRKANLDLSGMGEDRQMLITTDRPIYQPGQTLNVRGLLLKGASGMTVLAGTPIEFRIKDQDNTLLYREQIVTSPFGVAAISWQIPQSAKLGDYEIEIRDKDDSNISRHFVKVSRYDLPNFIVNAKPAKPYYLSSETQVEVEVRAEYLFGKPLPKGRVRVVREKGREWDSEQGKYVIDEGAASEGDTDETGKFLAKFDLAEEFKDLEDNDWQKYEDLEFTAYFTDPTTNRTEQRRFDIRYTREPIHVYVRQIKQYNRAELPVTGFVTTYYADGTPAQTNVEIFGAEDEDDDPSEWKSVTRIKTNADGIGRFIVRRPNIGEPDENIDFIARATDTEGRIGTGDEEFTFTEDAVMHLTTDKAIYRPGETMKVELRSTISSGRAFVNVLKNESSVSALTIRVTGGRATFEIPFETRFEGKLLIGVVMEDPEDDEDAVSDSTGVVFPAKSGINVDAKFDKEIYKPNDEASLSLRVSDRNGPVESVVGVTMLDQAVEERARTDSEGRGWQSRLGGYLGYGDQIGRINLKDIVELDLSKPISPELQLAAQLLLRSVYYNANIFRSEGFDSSARASYAVRFNTQFKQLLAALKDEFDADNFSYATDAASLKTILAKRGIDLAKMSDPWGMQFKPEFSVSRENAVVSVISAGPDKVFGTVDDITAATMNFAYFTPIGKAITTSAVSYHQRTGKLIREYDTLVNELKMPALLDKFGNPYRVSGQIRGRFFDLIIESNGPDGKKAEYRYGSDDFEVWRTSIDYFAATESRIARFQKELKIAPTTVEEFRQTLRNGGITDEQMLDPDGRELQIQVEKTSRYWDKVTLETVQSYGSDKRVERRIVTPVTQEILKFTIKSLGGDGKLNTWDDTTLTQIVHVLSERSKDNVRPIPTMRPVSYSVNSTSSIIGTVTDVAGAVVAGATVALNGADGGVIRSVTTNENGEFDFVGIAIGTYSIRVDAAGFKSAVYNDVIVRANSTTELKITIEVGGVTETVSVTSEAQVLQTTSASVVSSRQVAMLPLMARSALNLTLLQPGLGAKPKEEEIDTPRVRQYFPETLLWRPEIVVGADGRAKIDFRMADSITTWKMYTIASTKDGRIGFAEKSVTAFQSFFVDLDPPKFLTVGDEIHLPSQVRNYTDKKQTVNVTMTAADWFTPLASLTQKTEVNAGDASNAVFGFKTTRPIKAGPQRVTAIAQQDSDAIERPVTVRPDGREIVRTETAAINGSGKLNLTFPSETLPNSRSAEIKIYPNVMAHVSESVEGMLQRPYGCGEQTISSTYPSVMILNLVAANKAKIAADKFAKAKKYAQTGYDRIIGYQTASGGFSYWGQNDSPNVSLTAYALRFLNDVSNHVVVDPEIERKARLWLISQQRKDGGWRDIYSWERDANELQASDTVTTAFVVRVLTMTAMSNDVNEVAEPRRKAIMAALDLLGQRVAEFEDPYSMALFGIAAFDNGKVDVAQAVAQRLTSKTLSDRDGTYWDLISNTAFNGWGRTGRIETTALVAQLLLRLDANDANAARAIGTLIRSKDRYGVWYSTQTTVNVLDTLLATMKNSTSGVDQTIDVTVNGGTIKGIKIESDTIEQLSIEISKFISNGENEIEITSSSRSMLLTQLVSTHYVPWNQGEDLTRQVDNVRAVELDHKCNKLTPAIMETVTCSVKAERVGYQGTGMLLAEIGIPPGADVSRESLDNAMVGNWRLSKYEVLPDRIVLYMWAMPGGTKFTFSFKQRYGINAKTPASVLYDYYNPDARAVVPPMRFEAR